MELVILIDVSGSMNNKLYDELYGTEKKINLVKNFIATYLKDVFIDDISIIHLFSFSDTHKHLESFHKQSNFSQKEYMLNVAEKIFSENFICGGRTSIWDSLISLIDVLKNDGDNKKIICITDGEDGGSSNTYESVKQKINDNSHLELLIIDIDGSLSPDKDGKIIKKVKKPKDIKQVLLRDYMNSEKIIVKSLNITLSVIPVIPCDQEEISMVREAVREAVPYIEELTGLRYYPVPTYIVDEFTLKKYMDYPIPDEINDDMLKDTIYEILRFYRAVFKAIYNYDFMDNFDQKRGNCYPNELWDKYLKYNNDIMGFIIKICPNFLGVYDFINKGSFGFEYMIGFKYIESEFLYKYKDEISKYEAIMFELVQYLKFLNELNHYSYQIDLKHFDHDYNNDHKNDYPNLEVWEKILKNKEYEEILNCLQEDRSWKKDLGSIITVFKIALPILIKLLKEWQKLSSKWLRISKVIRTFGVYIQPNSESKKLEDLFIKNKFPAHFIENQGGKVLICLERCKKRLENIIDGKTQDDSIDANDLFARLIKSTIIHEHTHAITFEGVGNDSEPYYRNKTGIGRKKYRAVSETLAEWAELNYFRIHGDQELYEIVFNHANSDQFPDWAYAGALILERPDNELPAEILYRTLLEYFRINTNVAYRFLRA